MDHFTETDHRGRHSLPWRSHERVPLAREPAEDAQTATETSSGSERGRRCFSKRRTDMFDGSKKTKGCMSRQERERSSCGRSRVLIYRIGFTPGFTLTYRDIIDFRVDFAQVDCSRKLGCSVFWSNPSTMGTMGLVLFRRSRDEAAPLGVSSSKL